MSRKCRICSAISTSISSAPTIPTDAKDKTLSEAMTGAWARFAASGDPNGGGLNWPAYDAAKDNYLVFDAPIAQGAGWRTKEMDFFERVFAAG